MAVVGCLGDIVFQVSDEKMETIDKAKWSGSARYATHQRHNTNALTEFTGIDPDRFEFEITLTHELGVDVMSELVKLWDYERKGEALRLVLGDKGYGKYRWNILEHSMVFENYDKWGNLYSAMVTIKLQEYLR